jgi:HD-like signal output (HDOD) protein
LSSLQTAECCKKIVSADETASIASRDVAYSTGLCHNLGLMAVAHIAPAETHAVLENHSKSGKTPGLAKALSKKFETNHRIVTVALAEAWSLPGHMIAAYQFQAFPEQAVDDVLGRVLRAAIVAVGNTRADNDQQHDLSRYAKSLGIAGEDLEKMATLGDRQLGKVRSLVGNMAG